MTAAKRAFSGTGRFADRILVETAVSYSFSLPSLRCARPIRQIVQECFPLAPLAGGLRDGPAFAFVPVTPLPTNSIETTHPARRVSREVFWYAYLGRSE